MFAQSFSQVTKTYRYLLIILDRYDSSSRAFIKNTKAMQETIKPGKHQLTKEQERLHEQGWQLQVALEFEIDPFYIFAKMLLDKVAHALEFYFGKAPQCSLASHDKLTKCFNRYVPIKKLSPTPPPILEMLELLTH